MADVGGPAEIVQHGQNGLTCRHIGDLVDQTQGLIADRTVLRTLAEGAVARARDFETAAFTARVHDVVEMLFATPDAQAEFYLRDGNVRWAETLFSESVDRFPTSARPYLGLAECFYRTGQRELMLTMNRRYRRVLLTAWEAEHLQAYKCSWSETRSRHVTGLCVGLGFVFLVISDSPLWGLGLPGLRDWPMGVAGLWGASAAWGGLSLLPVRYLRFDDKRRHIGGVVKVGGVLVSVLILWPLVLYRNPIAALVYGAASLGVCGLVAATEWACMGLRRKLPIAEWPRRLC